MNAVLNRHAARQVASVKVDVFHDRIQRIAIQARCCATVKRVNATDVAVVFNQQDRLMLRYLPEEMGKRFLSRYNLLNLIKRKYLRLSGEPVSLYALRHLNITAETPEEIKMLEAIETNQFDNTGWLVFCDMIQENGREELAQQIRFALSLKNVIHL